MFEIRLFVHALVFSIIRFIWYWLYLQTGLRLWLERGWSDMIHMWIGTAWTKGTYACRQWQSTRKEVVVEVIVIINKVCIGTSVYCDSIIMSSSPYHRHHLVLQISFLSAVRSLPGELLHVLFIYDVCVAWFILRAVCLPHPRFMGLCPHCIWLIAFRIVHTSDMRENDMSTGSGPRPVTGFSMTSCLCHLLCIMFAR